MTKKLNTDISELANLDGFIGCCLVDSESGLMYQSIDGQGIMDLEVASAGNTEVVRSKLRVIEQLGLEDTIEDILITLGNHYHLIRPLQRNPNIFIYVAVERKNANLALTRLRVRKVEETLVM